jgi:tRNA (guanine37-N1)-methyltransferase
VKFSIITIFPELVRSFLDFGLLEKAIQNGLVEVEVYDLREFSRNKHRKVDDRPLGGGPGMVLMPDPLFRAVEHVKSLHPAGGRVILFSAYGRILDQKKVKALAGAGHLIMICGRYEGIDQRAIDQLVDEEISLGEYVLMGGEIAAEALLEAVSRMIPGVVGNPDSVVGDSFYQQDQFTFPQYTQPRTYRGLEVPGVLLSGHHKEIERWRAQNRKTRRKKNEADR